MDYGRQPPAATISYQDAVILYSSPQDITYIYIEKGAVHRTRYGDFPHDEIVGLEWGCKLWGQRGGGKRGGWLLALKPTAELWTSVLKTRTQIVYSIDASIIVFNLMLKPGDILLEAGTGSGSLTHSFARAVAPHGHIYTFEFKFH